MAIVDQIGEVLAAGHSDQDLVALPVSLLRVIQMDLRAGDAAIAQLAAASRIGDIGLELRR